MAQLPQSRFIISPCCATFWGVVPSTFQMVYFLRPPQFFHPPCSKSKSSKSGARIVRLFGKKRKKQTLNAGNLKMSGRRSNAEKGVDRHCTSRNVCGPSFKEMFQNIGTLKAVFFSPSTKNLTSFDTTCMF